MDGYPGAKFKKFYERHQAEDFLKTFENKIKEETPELKQETGMPFVDFWPDDVSADEEDDFLLVNIALFAHFHGCLHTFIYFAGFCCR